MNNDVLQTLQNIEALLTDIDGMLYIILIVGSILVFCSIVYKLLMRFA